MDISLILAIAALVLGAVAVLRSYVPPQQRVVNDALQRLVDVEEGLTALSARSNKRSRQENMEKAREAHEVRAERRDRIEEQAAAIIAQHAEKPAQQPTLQLAGGTDLKAAKAAMRRQLGI